MLWGQERGPPRLQGRSATPQMSSLGLGLLPAQEGGCVDLTQRRDVPVPWARVRQAPGTVLFPP